MWWIVGRIYCWGTEKALCILCQRWKGTFKTYLSYFFLFEIGSFTPWQGIKIRHLWTGNLERWLPSSGPRTPGIPDIYSKESANIYIYIYIYIYIMEWRNNSYWIRNGFCYMYFLKLPEPTSLSCGSWREILLILEGISRWKSLGRADFRGGNYQ